MLAQEKAKTSSVSFTAISWYLKLCQTHKRHLINVYWMTKWLSVVLCLFSHSLIAWTSWCHLAWQAPIHIVRLSSALTFSKPFLAPLLPKRRSTFLFVTLELPVVHCVCVCVCITVCACTSVSAVCVNLYIFSVSLPGYGSVTLQFTHLFTYLSPLLDGQLRGNWTASYSSLFL